MEAWLTPQALAEMGLRGLPGNFNNINKLAKRAGWREAVSATGEKLALRDQACGGWRYHRSLLPPEARDDLARRQDQPRRKSTPAPAKAKASLDKALARDARLAIVKAWEDWRSTREGTLEVLMFEFVRAYARRDFGDLAGLKPAVFEAVPSFGPRTLRKWVKDTATQGADGALDRRGRPKGQGVLERAFDGALMQSLQAWIAKEPMLTARQIRDFILADYGERVELVEGGEKITRPMPSEREFSRAMKKFKEENKALLAKVTHPDLYRGKFQVALGRHDEAVRAPNEVWEFDASPADVMLVEGRYSLYVLVDAYTRRMKALVTKTPRTASALHLVRLAIEDWGVPQTIRSDNGSDFTSHGLRSSIEALGIHHDICPPYSPEKKPLVERGIGTLQRDLMRTLDGFIGHDVTDRAQIEARKAFAARLGESDQNIFCVKMTAQELQAKVDAWLAHVYANGAHAGLGGQSPQAVYARWPGVLRRLEEPASLALLMAPIPSNKGLRTITKKGLRIGNEHYWDETLQVGQRVFVRFDPLDDSKVAVFSEDQSDFLCFAYSLSGLSGAQRRAVALAAKRAQSESLREDERRLRAAASKLDKNASAAKRAAFYAQRHNITALPKRSVTHTTASIEAAKAALKGPETGVQQPFNAAQKASQKAGREAVVLDLQAAQQPVAEKETATTRFARARALERRLEGGPAPRAEDLAWLEIYQKSAEYQARRAVEEQFGGLLFGPSGFEAAGQQAGG